MASFIFLSAVAVNLVGVVQPETCGMEKMAAILGGGGGEEGCTPRPTIISLPEPSDEYSQVTPSHLEVLRCSGSCMQPYHYCIPTYNTTKTVKVLLTLRSAVSGPAVTLCGEVEVEEHTQCSCGCDVTPDHCTEQQLFIPGECTCTCPNTQERDLCIAKNWYWNKELCQCMCPNLPYPTCPTSYVFDHETTCACRAVAYNAFTVYELVIVVVVVGSLATTLSLVQCYRHSTGFFRHRRQKASDQRVRSASFVQKIGSLGGRGRRRKNPDTQQEGQEAQEAQELLTMETEAGTVRGTGGRICTAGRNSSTARGNSSTAAEEKISTAEGKSTTAGENSSIAGEKNSIAEGKSTTAGEKNSIAGENNSIAGEKSSIAEKKSRTAEGNISTERGKNSSRASLVGGSNNSNTGEASSLAISLTAGDDGTVARSTVVE